MIYRSLIFAAGACTISMLAGCGGTEYVNIATLPDNYLCNQMKDVCKETRDFENSYAKMSAAERKDAENVLKAYRMQCADALDQCKKTVK